jgi:hypothetical protein
MYKIKQNILLAILFLVFSCDSGGGGSSSDNNCGTCPNNALSSNNGDNFHDLDNDGIYNSSVDDFIPQIHDLDADGVYTPMNCNDITALGCVNVIEAEVNEGGQTIIIYYNVNANISGFQFELTGVTIDSIESFLPSSFSISNNDSVVIAYDGTLSGDVISARCGILMKINYSSPINNPWNSSDFISNIVFAGDTYTNNIPNSLDICSN